MGDGNQSSLRTIGLNHGSALSLDTGGLWQPFFFRLESTTKGGKALGSVAADRAAGHATLTLFAGKDYGIAESNIIRGWGCKFNDAQSASSVFKYYGF